jgi:hypothetical protein
LEARAKNRKVKNIWSIIELAKIFSKIKEKNDYACFDFGFKTFIVYLSK